MINMAKDLNQQNDISKILSEVLLKYHFTGRQLLQIHNIIYSIVMQKKTILFVTPRFAGQSSVYLAVKEIIDKLGVQKSKLKLKIIK